jgi:NitT/TauT family transport system ATP-binding protein
LDSDPVTHGLNQGVTVRSVSKNFAVRRGPQLPAIADVSLDLMPGEFVCLIGPSGCGKSTLLNILAGFEAPSSGSVELDGRPISKPGPDRGFVFQEYAIFPWLSALDNIRFGLRKAGLRRGEQLKRSQQFIEVMGLRGFEHHYPHELSGGMQQRVAIARVLVIDPKILLMDEPFGALDAQTRTLMQVELHKIWQATRKTVLFVTHSVEEAIFLADRVVCMTKRPGRIKETVSIDLARPRDVTSPEFNEYRRQLNEIVFAEAAAETE